MYSPTGANWLNGRMAQAIWLGFVVLIGLATWRMGLLPGLAVVAAVPGLVVVHRLVTRPEWMLHSILVLGFFSNGLARYVSAPWGLMVDVLLLLAWLTLLWQWRVAAWSRLQTGVFWASLLWYGWVVFELVNPEATGFMPWFYAMRATGFEQMLMIGFLLMTIRDKGIYYRFLMAVFVLSTVGLLWGLKQQIVGLDAAEYKWLFVDGYAKTHMLFGVLRVFSFYSDAGQFGASQASIFLIAGILAIGPFPLRQRMLFGAVAFGALIGFAISGTRGALAVPGVGGIVYLIMIRNVKLLTVGLVALVTVFGVLKYTFMFQNVEQVRRMRTALDPNDASLQVRLANQRVFAGYLQSRPIGAGIGTVGYWGNRFSPGTFMASMPSDSYYVKIWAETGIVGVCLHMLMLGFLTGYCGATTFRLRDPMLRQICIALFSAWCGVLMASYGNQVYSQFPTSVMMFTAVALIVLAPTFEEKPTLEPDMNV